MIGDKYNLHCQQTSNRQNQFECSYSTGVSVASTAHNAVSAVEQSTNIHHNEPPPAYSFVDPNSSRTTPSNDINEASFASPQLQPPLLPARRTSTGAGMSEDLNINQISPKELEAVRGFAFDRPIYIHATNVSSSSLVVEPDMNTENRDTAIVIVQVSAQKSGIHEKCEITAQLNSHGEYDFHVNSTWSLWSMAMVRCRFIVRLPSSASMSHPGLRVDMSNSNIDMAHLTNIEFDHINIKAQNAPLTFNGIHVGYLQAATTNCEVRVTNVNIGTALDTKTSNARIAMTNIHGNRISAKTTNTSIVLQSVVGQIVNAETTNAKLHCADVKASELHLKTHNSTIVSSNITADQLYLTTANAKIEGTWEIKNMLDISTTNSKVDGYIVLSDPMARANMRIKTTNASIKVRLPAKSFSGGFDARTSNRSVTVDYRDKKAAASLPPLQFVVNEKHYKRGFLANAGQLRHEFSASTSNSGIDIEFV